MFKTMTVKFVYVLDAAFLGMHIFKHPSLEDRL